MQLAKWSPSRTVLLLCLFAYGVVSLIVLSYYTFRVAAKVTKPLLENKDTDIKTSSETSTEIQESSTFNISSPQAFPGILNHTQAMKTNSSSNGNIQPSTDFIGTTYTSWRNSHLDAKQNKTRNGNASSNPSTFLPKMESKYKESYVNGSESEFNKIGVKKLQRKKVHHYNLTNVTAMNNFSFHKSLSTFTTRVMNIKFTKYIRRSSVLPTLKKKSSKKPTRSRIRKISISNFRGSYVPTATTLTSNSAVQYTIGISNLNSYTQKSLSTIYTLMRNSSNHAILGINNTVPLYTRQSNIPIPSKQISYNYPSQRETGDSTQHTSFKNHSNQTTSIESGPNYPTTGINLTSADNAPLHSDSSTVVPPLSINSTNNTDKTQSKEVPSYIKMIIQATKERLNRTLNTTTLPLTPDIKLNLKPGEKIILAYMPEWYATDIGRTNFNGCKHRNCRLTQDRNYHKFSSAVIFNDKTLHDTYTDMSQVPTKLDSQLWIFHTDESPVHVAWRGMETQELNNMFDYTMSFRTDSKFWKPYGRIVPNPSPMNWNYDEVWKRKIRNIAWFESNCNTPSLRKHYVIQLQRYINVDIYGLCGTFKCGWSITLSNDICHVQVGHFYKFYLSFENSLCMDYITEKLYHIYRYQLPIIPVVRGAPNLKFFVPEGTYIDTRAFKSPKALANYLIEVGNDKEKYIGYLKRKSSFTAYLHEEFFQRSMCEICEEINKPLSRPAPANILSWMWKPQCIMPRFINDFYENGP